MCGRRWIRASPSAIEGGRHPVVEQALRAEGQSFVANDCDLGPSPLAGEGLRDSDRSAIAPHRRSAAPSPARGRGATLRPAASGLLTGPNMAGKSTFLRQNALIAILAQAGSFVPATAAHIGVVDAVFSRVGAADDLARGRSTFMVEMVETAAILNQAGPRSLVILDEIGRGTATFDGLSIAWAAVEHLHEENCFARALRHALSRADGALGKAAAAHQRHDEGEGVEGRRGVSARGGAGRRRPLLRHPGGEARRAAAVRSSQRAKQVLTMLEKGERARPVPIIDDLPLFAAKPAEEDSERTRRSRRSTRSIPTSCRRRRRWRGFMS